MSKRYRMFDEWEHDFVQESTLNLTFHEHRYEAWYAGRADLSAILGEFEALAGKWKKQCTHYDTATLYAADELSALIQSVKERM